MRRAGFDAGIGMVVDQPRHLVHAWLRRRPCQRRMLDIHGNVPALFHSCLGGGNIAGWRLTIGGMGVDGHVLIRKMLI